jgi:predicted TIM-barrel enzyme
LGTVSFPISCRYSAAWLVFICIGHVTEQRSATTKEAKPDILFQLGGPIADPVRIWRGDTAEAVHGFFGSNLDGG